MAERAGSPTIDVALDQFVAAWHAGAAPSAADACRQVAAADEHELERLIAAFLELAPTIPTTRLRTAALAADPLVQRISGLEDAAAS